MKIDNTVPLSSPTYPRDKESIHMTISIQNEVMKKRYSEFLRCAKQLSPLTVQCKLKSLYRFDDFCKNSEYKAFNKQMAKGFQDHLHKLSTKKEGISASTTYQSLKDVQEFLFWLSDKSGYKSKLHVEDIQYLNPSRALTQMMNNRLPRAYPANLTYLKRLVLSIKGQGELELRDRAIIAVLIMTGIRAESLATLSVDCVDMDRWIIDQNPARGVRTKFRKRIYTVILKIDGLFMEALEDWFNFLKKQNVASDTPLFPKSHLSHEQGSFSFINNKVSSNFMRGSQISQILKHRCKAAGEKYYSAHSIRHLHERILEKASPKAEQIKAVSQNMGHTHLATTLFSYGYIPETDRINILRGLDFRGIE